MSTETSPPHHQIPQSNRPEHPMLFFIAVVLVLAAVLLGTQLVFSRKATGEMAPGINSASGLVIGLDILPKHSRYKAVNFSLTDQYGRPLTLSQFRGKSVVLTFNDDQCQDLCTLLAQDVVAANNDLGSAMTHVEFVSVNANPFYPTVGDVRSWSDEHGLDKEANWIFGAAPPEPLRTVWHNYGVDVEPDPATKSVTHGTEIFFIDPSGTVRAIGDFGSSAANSAIFAHAMAQMAVDLLPASQRVDVKGPSATSAATGHISPGSPAQSFELPALDNSAQRISLDAFDGKPTVLNFWSSTCVPCKAEMPAIEQASKDLAGKVNFIGIDVADNPNSADAFVKQAGVTYPIADDSNGRIAGEYRISGTPYSVIIDGGNVIQVLHPGTFTTEQLEYVLQSKLG